MSVPARSIVSFFYHDDVTCPACRGGGIVCENHPDHIWDGTCCGGAGMPCPRGAPMPHPNDMSAWESIGCQRGHVVHASRVVHVDLAARHGYLDCCPVPARHARSFDMAIWPPEDYPVDGLAYCPAHDAVSETIVSHRIWEPRETVLALHAFAGAAPKQMFVDMGAQLGWFSLLAASAGLRVAAFDADPENLRLLRASADLNGWADLIDTYETRIGPSTTVAVPSEIRLAKLDLEGAEVDGIRMLWPSIEAGLVDHLLIEISPVFKPGDHYPRLLRSLVDVGYRAFLLPPKRRPPIELDDPEHALGPYELVGQFEEQVAGWHQEDVWMIRDGASW